MLENIEQMPLWHPCTDLLFELRQPLRLTHGKDSCWIVTLVS